MASAATTGRIISGTTSMLAISSTGYISLAQAGTNTGWFDPARGLVTIGVSSTGPVSATSGYFSGNVSSDGNFVLNANGGRLTWGAVTNDSIHGDGVNHYIRFTTSGTEAMRIVRVFSSASAPEHRAQSSR